MSWHAKFDPNPIIGLFANVWKLFDKSEAKTGGNSVEHGKKIIRPGEAHNELAHQISVQSIQHTGSGLNNIRC